MADGEAVIPPPPDETMAMRMPRVRFTIGRMMVAVAAVGIALTASRLSRHDLVHAYGMGVLGLIGLSPILICYLWLREPPGRASSTSIEILIGRFAIILATGRRLLGDDRLVSRPGPVRTIAGIGKTANSLAVRVASRGRRQGDG